MLNQNLASSRAAHFKCLEIWLIRRETKHFERSMMSWIKFLKHITSIAWNTSKALDKKWILLRNMIVGFFHTENDRPYFYFLGGRNATSSCNSHINYEIFIKYHITKSIAIILIEKIVSLQMVKSLLVFKRF